jgi:DNA-binding MarR family transcriptional regulator
MAEERSSKEPKDLRYRRAFFPAAETLVFSTERAGFVPLPILLRKLLRHLTAPELRVLIYLYLRASRHGICYPAQSEMLHELGLASTKHLRPHIKGLEEKGLISAHHAPETGKNFFLIHDPRIAIQRMIRAGKLTKEEMFAINDLCEDLNQPPIAPAANETAVEGEKAATSTNEDEPLKAPRRKFRFEREDESW